MNGVKKQLVSGVLYTSVAKYAGIVVSLAVTAVLARIFTPAQFGDVAVATVLIAFFAIFSDIGIGPAVIQRKELDAGDLDHIFSFTVWTGAAVSLLFFAAAGPIAAYYRSEVLAGLCRVLSLNLFFSSLNIVPNALLYKAKRFRFIAFRSLGVQTVCGAAAVAAACAGAGVYALTINPVLSSLLLFAINYRQQPLGLHPVPSSSALRKVFSFSAYQFAFNLINYFTRNLDKLLMGRYLSKESLGYYDKSYRLMMLPLQNITYVISPVMHPIFSDFQHDLRRLADSYLRVVRFLAFIGLPLSAGLFFTGRELVLLVFGSQWEASVAAFRILSLSVGLQIVLSTSGPIFQAADATRMLFLSGLLSAVSTIGAVLAGIFALGTVEGVAWCFLASLAVNFVQCFYLLLRRTLRVPWGGFWRSFLSPLGAAACVCLPLWTVGFLFPELPLTVSLAVKGAGAGVVYAAYIQFTGEYDLLRFVKTKLHRSK